VIRINSSMADTYRILHLRIYICCIHNRKPRLATARIPPKNQPLSFSGKMNRILMLIMRHHIPHRTPSSHHHHTLTTSHLITPLSPRCVQPTHLMTTFEPRKRNTAFTGVPAIPPTSSRRTNICIAPFTVSNRLQHICRSAIIEEPHNGRRPTP
jgi:hypothetical protein